MQKSRTGSSAWIFIGAALAAVCCACLVLATLAAGMLYYLAERGETPGGNTTFQEPLPPTVTVSRPPSESVPTTTEEALRETLVPESDPYSLACRLRGVCDVPLTVSAPATPFQIGDRRSFWALNSDTNTNFQVPTTLRYITAHSYFWLENGVEANDSDIAALMTAFEDKIYPTDTRFFGSEWTPGVDNDPHIYVLYVRGIGANAAGYYSTPDELNPLVRKYSNAAELFVFSADSESLSNEYTFGTLAHEFQHMIHWHQDRNESTWMNEGFSELAAFLNGYTVGGMDYSYAQHPDLSLPDWTSLTDSPQITGDHYGQSFLFLTYFLDRFGEQATQALIRDPENSLTSIDNVLKSLGITDPQSGQPIRADDVVMDWMDTLYLGDSSVGDGRFAYHNYTSAPRVAATQKIADCPHKGANSSVNQYGPEYVEITCPGEHVLSFAGSTVARVLPADAHSGAYAFWSNKGDSSDMTLTRSFDFTDVNAPIDFSYWTWYDIEKGYDYVYLEASTDGQGWTILDTPSCTNNDTSGNAHGCAYTAKSSGGQTSQWINESIDLSDYAGQKVSLRFEYLTDEGLNGEGLLLDDLSIPAVNYRADFESDDGGWEPDGFVRIENSLPQTFRLSLILQGPGDTTVRSIPVNADQTATVPISLEPGGGAVLVVTGTQRFTRLPAGYSLEVK